MFQTLDNIFGLRPVIYLVSKLSFEKPDINKFRCIDLAYNALETGGTCSSVLNIANDLAVASFLNGEISFSRIPELIEMSLQEHDFIKEPTLNDIYNQIEWVNNYMSKKLVKT